MATYSIDDYAHCVKSFSGGDDEFVDSFIQQINLIQQEFRIQDTDLKMLIIKKLDGNALAWFHCKPSHITMSPLALLDDLRRTFGNNAHQQKQLEKFNERVWNWKQKEPFLTYYHDKLKLCAGLNLSEGTIVNSIIDGFGIEILSKLARAMNITTTSDLLVRMQREIEKFVEEQLTVQEEINPSSYSKQPDNNESKKKTDGVKKKLPKQKPAESSKQVTEEPKQIDENAEQNKNTQTKIKKPLNKIQCFRCLEFGHEMKNCPTESKLDITQVQCFKCNTIGHKIENCTVKIQSDIADLQCYKCKGYGHIMENCSSPIYSDKPLNKSLKKPLNKRNQEHTKCLKCKRFGHQTEDCYFNRLEKRGNNQTVNNLSGKLERTSIGSKKKTCNFSFADIGGLSHEKLCKNCFRLGHSANICKFPRMPQGVCHNCGSTGHMRPNCPYLKKNVNGFNDVKAQSTNDKKVDATGDIKKNCKVSDETKENADVNENFKKDHLLFNVE